MSPSDKPLHLKAAAFSKERAAQFLPELLGNYYVPSIRVAEFLGVTDQAVRNWVRTGELAGAKLKANEISISTSSLRNYLLRRGVFVPGFNCPEIQDWSPEVYDVIPRDGQVDTLTETQATAVLVKIAKVFNGRVGKSNKFKLKEIITVINTSLTSVAAAKAKKVGNKDADEPS